MFTNNFLEVPTLEIVDEVRREGYFYTEIALPEATVDQLLAEVNFDEILVNANTVGTVTSGNQRFLTHCLATSKKAYDIITSQKVLDICNAYFTERYQLTNHRFCQTRHGFHMPWHTDNNLQLGRNLSGKHSMPGLLFLFYLSEENYSPFQYLKGSHVWSHQHDDEIYLSDEWVNTHHSDAIVNIAMVKGGLLICDTHGIHRAAPFKTRHHRRNIMLFQVDQVGDGYLGHGEQNLVNTEFIDSTSPELFSYLGFGVKRDYPAFPNSSVATMTPQDILRMQQQILPLVLKASFKQLMKTLVPGPVMVHLKRQIWAAGTVRWSKTGPEGPSQPSPAPSPSHVPQPFHSRQTGLPNSPDPAREPAIRQPCPQNSNR
jgi:hypothetical protein